jgi:hypothetical protein
MTPEQWEKVFATHLAPDGINPKIYSVSRQPIQFFPYDRSPQYQAERNSRSQLNHSRTEFEDPLDVSGSSQSSEKLLVSDSSFFLHMGGVIAQVKVPDFFHC